MWGPGMIQPWPRIYQLVVQVSWSTADDWTVSPAVSQCTFRLFSHFWQGIEANILSAWVSHILHDGLPTSLAPRHVSLHHDGIRIDEMFITQGQVGIRDELMHKFCNESLGSRRKHRSFKRAFGKRNRCTTKRFPKLSGPGNYTKYSPL